MAASMKDVSFSVLRILLRRNGFLKGGRTSSSVQSFRNKSYNVEETHYVALSEDESTVLCYHPEPDFPYEYTRPIPRKVEEIAEADSALKVQYRVEDHLRFRQKGPTNKELANMFFTTKHQWFPSRGKQYKRSVNPKERDSI